jgi:uncharacterized protein YndB with AHSA1/START domain
MQTVERFVTSASAEMVWRILADVERWKDWTPTILEVRPLTHEGLRVGARYRVTQPGLKPAVYEVTDCTPNQGFTWVQRLPGGELIAGHRIQTRDGMTEVEHSYSSKGPSANIAVMLFSKKIRESVTTEAQGLKERCEAMMKS